MDTGTKGPPLRLEHVASYLDDKLEHEAQVLDLLIVAQARGQANQELWDKLHSAALRDDRLSELAFAYEKLGQDRRVRIMPPAYQAQIFMNAARYFVRALGDIDGAQTAFERVLSLVPGHPEAFEQLRRILEDKGDKEKLVSMHLAAVGPKTDKEVAITHLRAALELATEADPERASKIGQQILKLDPSNQEALAALCASLEAQGKFPELARTLEQSVNTDPPPDEARRLELRTRLLELYDDKVPEIERAAPHVEEVLANDPTNAIARRVAQRLLGNKAVAARAAAALEKVFESEGDRAAVAQMLAAQIEQLRGPKKAEAQKRLGLILHEDGDELNAFANFEAVLSIDPADEDVRTRYVDLARKLGKQADASKMLSRAAAAVKSPQARAKINLETARFLAEMGDPKRARVILQGVLDQAEDDVALEAARALRALAPEPKALAPILESIAKTTPDVEEKLGVLRELAALYESSLDDLASAIQARKRVLQIDPTAEPEELERLLEARKDWATLAEVLEIRASSLPFSEEGAPTEERRGMLMRAAELRVSEVADDEGAARLLSQIRTEHGVARDVHSLLLPLLDKAQNHEGLIEVLTSEIDLADEEERPALITRLAESLLATAKIDDALDAFAEVIAVRPVEPRARERLLEIMRGWSPPGGEQAEGSAATARLRAAEILAPVFRNEDDGPSLVGALDVIAELDADPQARLLALAEAHDRVESIGKDKIRALFLAGRGLREAVAHDLEQVPDWLERIGRSESGPSKAAVAETLASAIRDRQIDHPNLARLAQRSGEAYAEAKDLTRAIESYRRVLEFEPDNEEMVERIDHLLAEKGSPEERITLYRSALLRPGSLERKRGLYLAIGGVQTDQLSNLDEAIATYREALEALPNDRPLRDALLDALEQAKRYPELYEELVADRDAGDADLTTAELDLRLADVAVLQSDVPSAVRHYRDALRVDALDVGEDVLDHAEELAKAQVDVPLLVAVAERRVRRAEPGAARAGRLEQLGALFGDRSGDPARAAQCFFDAGEAALEAGDTSRAATDFERVLVYQPQTREALERLLRIHAENGDLPRLLDVTSRLLKLTEDASESLELVDQVTSEVTGAPSGADHLDALLELVAAIERRFEPSMATVRARTRVLGGAGRTVEAADAVAAMLDNEAQAEEAADVLAELLAEHAGDERLHGTQRRLLEYRVASAADDAIRQRRLDLLRFERDVAKDAARSATVLDALLDADPEDEDALIERQRLAMASEDYATAAKCLERRLAATEDDDARAARAAELGRLRLGELKDVAGALDAIEPLAVSRPDDRAVSEIALAALGDAEQGPRAARLLVRVAEAAPDPQSRAFLYKALFDRAEAEPDPNAILGGSVAPLYRAWLESLEDDPKTALTVAARAARRAPEEEEFWDRAEELTRSAHEPGPTAQAYRDVLSSASGLDQAVIMQVGERGVAFHEEWFDDTELVTGMLRQVVEAAPAATWAFERLKLIYNAAERWQELFELYDRVIAAQTDDEGRSLILEDAVEVARDLAGDSERAIVYLEQLRSLRPRDAKLEAQLERLYERQGKSDSLVGLLTQRLERLEDDDARATRFRIAALLESSGGRLTTALEAVAPLVEAGDDKAVALVERWLSDTTPALEGRAGGFRVLSRAVADAHAVRTPAARTLEPLYTSRGEEGKAARMLEVLLESESDHAERLKLLRSLSERKIKLGDPNGALEATLAEIVLTKNEEEEKASVDAALLGAAGDKTLLGRTIDALREIGEEDADKNRSLRLLRRASVIAREDLADETRSITIDLAILSRSDEDPAGARLAARKLDRDLQTAGREVERCAVLERLAILEDTPEARREALLEAARISEEAGGDRERAVKNLRKWLEEAPGDVAVLTKLIDNLRAQDDSAGLVGALQARSSSTSSKEDAKADRIDRARILARKIEDHAAAIDAYRELIELHGATDELVDELAGELDADGRDVEHAELLRAEAKRATDDERKSLLFARLGEIERRRVELELSLDAFVEALALVPSSQRAQVGLQTLLGALSPTEPATRAVFAKGVTVLGESFERAEQLDRWLALVPARLLALETDQEKADLLLKAAGREEDLTNNALNALRHTAQAFALVPAHPGAAPALLERSRKTGRWELATPHLLPALASEEIASLVARDLLVEAAAWAASSSKAQDGESLAEGFLAAAHTRLPQDEDVLERLIEHRRRAPGKPLVDALLTLSLLGSRPTAPQPPRDLDLLREALAVTLRETGDESEAISIAERIIDAASRRLGAGADEDAEDALGWAIEIAEPIWQGAGENDRLRTTYVKASDLSIKPDRARVYLVLAAELAVPEEAVTLYERLYAANAEDAHVAERLSQLYADLGRHVELARLYGRMAETTFESEERARLRLLQAEILVGLQQPDNAVSVLRQSIADYASHEATVELLATLLDQKKSYGDLCALMETQADLARRPKPERALRFYLRASELADVHMKDVNRAARSFRRAVEIDASQDNLDKFASLLERSKQYDDEAQVLERLIEAFGRDDDLSLRLAAAYGHAGKVERAREELERAIAGGKASPKVREVLGSIYRAAGAWESLAELYEAEANDAEDEDIKVGRLREAAQVYVVNLQRPEAAVRLLQQAAELRKDDLESALTLVAALRVAGQLDDARATAGRLLAEFGNRKPKERALVHFELAKVGVAAKDRASALTELETATKIDPAHAGVLQLLGEIALDEGQFLRAQRTYRGLLLVLRAQRADRGGQTTEGLFAAPNVYKSQVFVELAFIAERQKEPERKAEFVESAFEASRESAAESAALVKALERRGYHDLVARALGAKLEAHDLDPLERSELELALADIYGKRLNRPKEAADLAISTFNRVLEAEGGALGLPRGAKLEARVAKILEELGQLELLYEAMRSRAESALGDERASLLLRAASIAETFLHDDERAATSLERVIEAWDESGAGTTDERLALLGRLDPILTRLVAKGASTDRHARVLEQTVDLQTAQGISFAAMLDPFYRLLEIYVSGAHVDSAYNFLERAVREDADGDRVEQRLRDTIGRCTGDNRFIRLLEDFGRGRGRGRAVVDALEILADRSTDPADHLREAYEASVDLEDNALTERLLRRIVPADKADDTEELAWAIVDLAERRFAASDARESADLWERAAAVSDPTDERALLLRVADLSNRILGDSDRAVALYEKLRQREPADREFWTPLSEIYSARGDTESLAQLMDETIPLVDEPQERAKLRLSLARLLEKTDPDRAADVLAEAVDEDPTSKDAAALLERLYESTGRDDKLTLLLDRQLDVAKDADDKDRVVALSIRIGSLRERLKEEDAALDAYHGALDWDPNNLTALRAAVRLLSAREDAMAIVDLLDRSLELEQGDEAAAVALKVADMKLSSGDPDGAERALVVGLKAAPRSAELKQRLMALYTERNDRVGLARVAAADARLIPDPAARRAALLQSAEVVKDEGDPREAADLYGESLDIEPNDRDTLFYFMEMCANSSQHARAIASVDRALAIDTGDPWLLFSRAVLREAVGESDSALDDLEAAFDKSGGQYANELRAHLEAALVRIASDPSASRRSEAALRLRLAEVAAAGGDVDSARAFVEELLQSDPHSAAAHAALGKIEELSGRPDAAALTYARAVGLAHGPELAQIATRLFDASRSVDRLALARAGLEKAVQELPNDEGLRASLRVVYESTGALQELAEMTVDDAQRLEDIEARYAKLLEAARLLLYGTGEASTGPAMAERALSVLDAARELKPQDPDVLQLSSEALAAVGRGDEAKGMLGQLIAAHRNKRSRELGQLYYSLYRVEAKGGNLSEALEALSKAHENQPQNGGLALELGQLATDLDDQDVAQRAFRTVTLLKTDGTSGVTPQDRAIAYYHLGSIAYRQGDVRRAKLMLEKALAEDPAIHGARELLGQLG